MKRKYKKQLKMLEQNKGITIPYKILEELKDPKQYVYVAECSGFDEYDLLAICDSETKAWIVCCDKWNKNIEHCRIGLKNDTRTTKEEKKEFVRMWIKERKKYKINRMEVL